MTPHSTLSESDIKFIQKLAREAGQVALDMRQDVGVHHKTGPHDLVTDADLTISHLLIKALKERFPEDLIVSEEDQHPVYAKGAPEAPSSRRIWLLDPIDGTENYVKNDGQYTTMLGLLLDGVPYFGCIYQPSSDTLFYGGAEFGAWKQTGTDEPVRYLRSRPLAQKLPMRLVMGWSDRKKYPWVMQLPDVKLVSSDSLGLKILKILNDEADLFVSLTGRIKLWDTAAPAAIAMGAAVDVGTAEGTALPYPVPHIQHGSSVIIGRPGALSWAMHNLHTKSHQRPQ